MSGSQHAAPGSLPRHHPLPLHIPGIRLHSGEPDTATTEVTAVDTPVRSGGPIDVDDKDVNMDKYDDTIKVKETYSGIDNADGAYYSKPDNTVADASDLNRAPLDSTPATPLTDDIGPPPDGGRQAWLAVFSTMFLLFTVFGLMTSNGQLQAYWIKHQLVGMSKSQVAWIGSVQTFVEFLLAFLGGRYFDVHGAPFLVAGGAALAFGSTIAMAFSYKYYHFLLSFVAFGLSGAFIYAPATAIAAHWFLRRRGLAIAIITCGTGIGGVVYPLMLSGLFARMSYRNAMLILAGFNGVLMLPALFFMRGRLPPRQPPPWKSMIRPWHDRRYAMLVVAAIFYGLNFLSPYFFAINLAQANAATPGIQKYAIVILQAASVPGRLASGMMADRFGALHVFAGTSILCAVSMFAFWAPPNLGSAPTVLGLLTFGWGSGGWLVTVGSATAAISPIQETGMRFGMLITALAIPTLVGPVISGQLITVGKDKLEYMAIFCGVGYFIGGMLTLVVPLLGKMNRSKRSAESVEAASAGDIAGGGEEDMPTLSATPGPAVSSEK